MDENDAEFHEYYGWNIVKVLASFNGLRTPIFLTEIFTVIMYFTPGHILKYYYRMTEK